MVRGRGFPNSPHQTAAVSVRHRGLTIPGHRPGAMRYLYLGLARIRRTEVRPICTRRAISDLLTPARCSFRISAAWIAAVAGRPSRLPFCRAWAKPARVRSRRISRSNSANMASRPAMARPGGRSQIQRLGQRNEADAEMLQFLKGRQQIRYRPAPAVQPPHQHDIDLAAAGGLQQFLTSFSLGRTGADLTDLHGNGPAAPGGILPHGATLHRQRLLIVSGNAGIQASAEHFRRSSVPGQKRYRILPLERPVWRAFQSVTQPWPQSILFGQAGSIILQRVCSVSR